MIKKVKGRYPAPTLPASYGEALSYMEAVAKCAEGVNELVDITDNLDKEIKELEFDVGELDNTVGQHTQDIETLDGALTAHKNDKANPHEVTKEQVGLGNVDNTSDLNKPISTATQTALNGKMDLMSFEQLYYYEVTGGGGLVNFTADKNGNLFNLKAAYVMIACGEDVENVQIAGHFFFDNSSATLDRIQFTMGGASPDYRADFFGYKLGTNLWITGYDNFREKTTTFAKYAPAGHYELPLVDEHHHITKISLSRSAGLPVGTKIKIFGIQDTTN